MRRRWVLYRCWAGSASIMEPHETKHRFWFHKSAQRCANRLTCGLGGGVWFEVRRVDTPIDHAARS